MDKKCQKCKVVKSTSEFHKNRAQPDGFAGYCKPCKSDSQNHRQRRYQLSENDYQNLLDSQSNSCSICGTTDSGFKKGAGFAVDHNHNCCPGIYSCGRCVRGLLCNSCNWGLGHFKDNPETLISAVAYLLAHNKCRDQQSNVVSAGATQCAINNLAIQCQRR